MIPESVVEIELKNSNMLIDVSNIGRLQVDYDEYSIEISYNMSLADGKTGFIINFDSTEKLKENYNKIKGALEI